MSTENLQSLRYRIEPPLEGGDWLVVDTAEGERIMGTFANGQAKQAQDFMDLLNTGKPPVVAPMDPDFAKAVEQVVQDFYNSGNHALQADAMAREIVKLRQMNALQAKDLAEARGEAAKTQVRAVALLEELESLRKQFPTTR